MAFNSVEKAVDDFLSGLDAHQNIVVALSGGKDSIALLHCLAQQVSHDQLFAIYINHKLQSESDSWGNFCREFCQQQSVFFEELTVKVSAKRRKGLEAVAREARYQALYSWLDKNQNTVLVTAHHLQDQTETVLLNLFRGTGLLGLRGMRYQSVKKTNVVDVNHYRPLLSVEMESIKDYLFQNNLSWVDDPSNQDMVFSRNYLRNELLPKVYAKWPRLNQAVSSLTENVSEAMGLLEELAVEDLSGVEYSSFSLDLSVLQQYSWARQKNVIQYWRQREQPNIHFNRIIYDWLEEGIGLENPDALPVRKLSDSCEIRLRGKRLYLIDGFQENYRIEGIPKVWEKLHFDENALLTHELAPHWFDHKIIVRSVNTLDFEQFPGLKKWLKSRPITPWNRRRWPIVEIDGEVAAVMGYCTNEKFKK